MKKEGASVTACVLYLGCTFIWLSQQEMLLAEQHLNRAKTKPSGVAPSGLPQVCCLPLKYSIAEVSEECQTCA